MAWDDDHLKYGYVITRLPEGDWWHMHFGRAALRYQCELLGRETDVFASIHRFARGCIARSPQFVLTLDGEGVDLPISELSLDCHWDSDEEVSADAKHFQASIMPLVYDSPAMQGAVAELVRAGRYVRRVAPGKLVRA